LTVRGAWFLGFLVAGLTAPAWAAGPLTITSGPDYGIWQIGRVEAPITVTEGTGLNDLKPGQLVLPDFCKTIHSDRWKYRVWIPEYRLSIWGWHNLDRG